MLVFNLCLLAAASSRPLVVGAPPCVARAGALLGESARSACASAVSPRGGLARLLASSPRILTEENARAVLAECMDELGTMFGTNAESARVGITGVVEFVELDGPELVVRLEGRFWHQRSRVVERVSAYVLERIPECLEVVIEDPVQLDDADPPVQFGNE